MVVLQSLKVIRGGDRVVLKRGRARRALNLGHSTPKVNLDLAHTLLTISAQEFDQKWNFDPIRGEPLEGKYEWEPAPPTTTTAVPPTTIAATTISSNSTTIQTSRTTTTTTAATSTAPSAATTTIYNQSETTIPPPAAATTTTTTTIPLASATTTTSTVVPATTTSTELPPSTTTTTTTNIGGRSCDVILRQTCITDFALPRKRRRLATFPKSSVLRRPISALV